MFAIAYDFDTDAMKIHLGEVSYHNGYTNFKKFMSQRGFTGQQGSVLYGKPGVSSVDTLIAVTDAAKHFPWLKECVKDIRLLEVTHNDALSVLL